MADEFKGQEGLYREKVCSFLHLELSEMDSKKSFHIQENTILDMHEPIDSLAKTRLLLSMH